MKLTPYLNLQRSGSIGFLFNALDGQVMEDKFGVSRMFNCSLKK